MRAATVSCVLAVITASAAADTVTLKGGKKLEGVVCLERVDGDPVVVNPFNSRCPLMTYGITDKERYAADKIESVVHADAPLVEYRERASDPKIDAAGHAELAKFCGERKLAEERDRELKLALAGDPSNAEALAALGKANWLAWSKGNPIADADLRRLETEYVGLEKPAELQTQWEQMTAKGTTRPRAYLERARRSKKFPLGRRDKVPLTVRSELAVGANYCVYLPRTYDPLVPTGLVVGLHGGGQGAKNDPTLVTGNGQEAMNFYTDVAEERGVIVVCPSALAAPWSDKKNEPFIDALIDEMKILYNVDESRIWLTGHSMGGGGTWYWGPQRAEVWAAFAPCAGFNAGPTKGLPVYVYHGSDDQICPPGNDRSAAETLRKDKADFVYTEIDKVGHGFPDWVRHDIFRFFTGRWKDDGKKRAVWPRSSFDKKATKDEIKCFGDPAATSTGAPVDAKTADLVADLEKGGGRGVTAAAELAKHKDAATVAAVARVLRSKKASTDARVLAAKTIGDIGLPDGVKQLAPEASTEDWRVLDAVTESLAKLAGKDKESVDALVRAGKQFGVFWEKSNAGGQFDFTEYEIRCTSFAGLCDAFAAVGDAAAFLPVIEKEIVARVYVPKTAYVVPIDDRFVHIPPRARLTLVAALHKCLVALKDPRGKALLESIKTAWAKEPRLVAEADAGIAEL